MCVNVIVHSLPSREVPLRTTFKSEDGLTDMSKRDFFKKKKKRQWWRMPLGGSLSLRSEQVPGQPGLLHRETLS